ncbi:unnamed protein product [Polarella glacialis]|uniref:Uncharacterized protein n=1 Tax=Polarella glacialis TaxID=89957 RepID=A0A813D540_POLGL|nr:unnamed protein product [Polarella glacialis]
MSTHLDKSAPTHARSVSQQTAPWESHRLALGSCCFCAGWRQLSAKSLAMGVLDGKWEMSGASGCYRYVVRRWAVTPAKIIMHLCQVDGGIRCGPGMLAHVGEARLAWTMPGCEKEPCYLVQKDRFSAKKSLHPAFESFGIPPEPPRPDGPRPHDTISFDGCWEILPSLLSLFAPGVHRLEITGGICHDAFGCRLPLKAVRNVMTLCNTPLWRDELCLYWLSARGELLICTAIIR